MSKRLGLFPSAREMWMPRSPKLIASKIDDATEDRGAIATLAPLDDNKSADTLDFLKIANREFSEGEVSSLLTIRFLIEKVEELKQEIKEIRPYQQRYYESDRDLQIERSRNKLGILQDAVSSALLTVGGVGMGISANYFATKPAPSIAAFLVSLVVCAASLVLKVKPK